MEAESTLVFFESLLFDLFDNLDPSISISVT